jgi:putative transcription antitermination factor YqgF
MTKYLGIDYGLAHVGIATSEHTLATPLQSMRNDGKLIQKLTTLIKSEGIELVVCGIPEGKLAPVIELFATNLRLAAGVPVDLHLETLTTQDAKQKLRESGASRAKRKDDHAYAACLILEDYLELHNSVN